MKLYAEISSSSTGDTAAIIDRSSGSDGTCTALIFGRHATIEKRDDGYLIEIYDKQRNCTGIAMVRGYRDIRGLDSGDDISRVPWTVVTRSGKEKVEE